MVLSLLTRMSRVSSMAYLAVCAVLLSFALFEVLDIDGSNLPAAAATVLEAGQSGEIKQACPHATAVAKSLVAQPRPAEIGRHGVHECLVVLPHSHPTHGSHSALPRAKLPEPPPL